MGKKTRVTSGIESVLPSKVYLSGAQRWIVRDTDAPVIFHDLIIEHRVFDRMINLTFGAILQVPGNAAEVVPMSHHRMSVESAQILRDILTGLIEGALKPAPKETAN